MRIGILGGGQLGRMLALQMHPMGLFPTIYTNSLSDPALQVVSSYKVAPYDDWESLESFAKNQDVITYEFENIPLKTALFIEGLGKTLSPSSTVLSISQNRVHEKEFCTRLDLAVVPYSKIKTRFELEECLDEYGEGILKTVTDGYDGKGQWVLTAPLSKDFVFPHDPKHSHYPTLILEKKISLLKEFSLIIARKKSGETELFQAGENRHEKGVLRSTTVPLVLDEVLYRKAKISLLKLAHSLDLVGLLTVEFFVSTQGDLFINEMAPRAHNSGHWTLDGCNVSQFEQWARAISFYPLIKPQTLCSCEMVNLLGEEIFTKASLRMRSDVRWHDYGKKEVKAGRKMGHYTLLSGV